MKVIVEVKMNQLDFVPSVTPLGYSATRNRFDHMSTCWLNPKTFFCGICKISTLKAQLEIWQIFTGPLLNQSSFAGFRPEGFVEFVASESNSFAFFSWVSLRTVTFIFVLRLWGVALRDDTKNGCVAHYWLRSTQELHFDFQLSQAGQD